MWLEEFSRTPDISFLSDETIRIGNVRDFTWSGESYTKRWITRTITRGDVERAHVLCEHLRSSGTHVFICFETTLDPLCISIEARRTSGQRYSSIKGLFGAYELIYLYGSARDIIGKRLERMSEFDSCELILDDDERWQLFASLARGAERTVRTPHKYHTLRRNCVTELFTHLPVDKTPLLPQRAGPFLVSVGRAHPCDIYDAEHPPPFY
ncbi:MAG: DUF4105 domain-containing protein [Candidatus Woesearchaeota archaeon]